MVSSSFNAWLWVTFKCCIIYEAGECPFYFANELANHQQSSIPCRWHNNTTDPLWGCRKGIPVCKHYSSNMSFSIGFCLIIDQSHAMPVRLGGGSWWWWMTNQQESCIFPLVSSYKFLYVSQCGNIVPIFSPNTQQITTIPLYLLVFTIGSHHLGIILWDVISIFSPVCHSFSLY